MNSKTRFPLITAHSGAEGTVPNSIEFIHVAAQSGADYAELDLRLTQDNVPVFFHDPAIVLSPGKKLVVAETDFAVLRQAAGSKIIPVTDILEAVRETGITINLDVKDTAALEFLEPFLKKLGMGERIILSGLHEKDVAQIQETFPEFRCMLNLDYEFEKAEEKVDAEEVFRWGLKAAVQLKSSFINLLYNRCCPDWVEWAHGEGVGISVWTLNDAVLFRRFIDMGVDSITTNKVCLLKRSWTMEA